MNAREILEKNLGQKIPEGKTGSGSLFFIGTEPFTNQKEIDLALADLKSLVPKKKEVPQQNAIDELRNLGYNQCRTDTLKKMFGEE